MCRALDAKNSGWQLSKRDRQSIKGCWLVGQTVGLAVDQQQSFLCQQDCNHQPPAGRQHLLLANLDQRQAMTRSRTIAHCIERLLILCCILHRLLTPKSSVHFEYTAKNRESMCLAILSLVGPVYRPLVCCPWGNSQRSQGHWYTPEPSHSNMSVNVLNT